MQIIYIHIPAGEMPNIISCFFFIRFCEIRADN